ncbi:pentatricopeptide repeat-containing protein At5g04780, mitochondrial-like [Malania oleifera]|uniref:pentatricopeptide repeat-containing protein At5g04780, mitochondrial-like n=1 Tax=Malania oleifera TaxID=397392 RepID=UPI0025AE8AF7|nr:pentatricopeptide repeat-containing protein At5g04780, mitochondrial-like [Malania oleifera]
MASIQSGMLPCSHLHDSPTLNLSNHKLNIFAPKFRDRALTARIVRSNDTKVTNQRFRQAHLVTLPGHGNSSSGRSFHGKNETDDVFLSLLKKISINTRNDGNSSSSRSFHGNDETDDVFLSLLKKISINTRNSSHCRQIHAKFVKSGAFEASSLIRNKLVVWYSRNKDSLDFARRLFDEIPERTAPTYAALIGSYCRSERWEDLFLILGLMVRDGMLPDKYLVPTVLKACSATQVWKSGRMVHGYVTRKGLESEIYVGNALVDLYANCGDMRSSRNVFDRMPERDVVSWTALVSGYMDGGLLHDAEEIFHSMQLNRVKPDLISWNTLISGLTRNGKLDLALKSLEQMQEEGLKPMVNSWNGIISGCVQKGYFVEALEIFMRMLWFPEDPNVVTIVSILPACARLNNLNLGMAVHGCALKHDFCGNTYVEGSLIDMYSKCGRIDYAESVFAEAENKDTAMWNELIGAYVNEGKMDTALKLLKLMQNEGFKPDVITYNTVLSGYARMGKKEDAFRLLSEMVQMDLQPNFISFNTLLSGFQQSGLSYEALKLFKAMQSASFAGFTAERLNLPIQPNPVTATAALAACADLNFLLQGKEIHGHVVRNCLEPNAFVSSALVDMYAKCHYMGSAEKVFLRIEDRNTVAWNAYLSGHINNMQLEEAVKLFCEMLGEGVEPSSITFSMLLPACGDMAALRVGRKLHGYIVKCGVDEPNNSLGSHLVSMYAKCGSSVEAKLVFDSEAEKDVGLWNAMISAYASNGMAANAIALFEKMELLGIVPDHITFIVLLSACVHDGLVEEGWKYFNSMRNLYGITAGLEHYTCMVSILGGAGLLEEALEFIKQMPVVPNACTWTALLQACRVYSNPEIVKRAADALSELEPNDYSNYILLSNIHASPTMWDSTNSLDSSMMDHQLMSIKECSFINVGSKIHTFRGRESSNSELEKTLGTWDKLANKMKRAGHSPLDPLSNHEDEHNSVSCLHTEKLAICYGIISSKGYDPIRISKNMRMCLDCHTTAKLLSQTDEREIFVKDVCFCHHFKDGICGCQDRW